MSMGFRRLEATGSMMYALSTVECCGTRKYRRGKHLQTRCPLVYVCSVLVFLPVWRAAHATPKLVYKHAVVRTVL